MFVVHGTRVFLDHVAPSGAAPGDQQASGLGAWHATVVPARPELALFVHDATLFPFLVPFAPSANLMYRFERELAWSLADGLWIDEHFVYSQISAMGRAQFQPLQGGPVQSQMCDYERRITWERPDFDPAVQALRLAASTEIEGPGGRRTVPLAEMIRYLEELRTGRPHLHRRSEEEPGRSSDRDRFFSPGRSGTGQHGVDAA